MNVQRLGPTASLLTIGPNSGMVLIAGGANLAQFENSTELYNPNTNTFTPAASMQRARYRATAITITSGPNSGKILILGGRSDGDTATASTELYDPVTGTFASNPATMNFASTSPGGPGAEATTLTSGPNAGKILIGGGSGPGSNPGSTELYDPDTNTFAAAADTAVMNLARQGTTASLLVSGPNAGWVLFAGGVYNGSVTSTELYNSATNSFEPASVTPVMNIAREGALAIQLPPAPNGIDATPLTISIVAPTATTYLLNQAVAASYTCTDPDDAVTLCAGPVADGANIDTA
jgi:hypothetical protein